MYRKMLHECGTPSQLYTLFSGGGRRRGQIDLFSLHDWRGKGKDLGHVYLLTKTLLLVQVFKMLNDRNRRMG